MPRYTRDEPDDDDDESYPDGVYDDDGPPTVECRKCGDEIYEDADQCPHCGTYQSDEDAGQGPRRSTWISIMLILALLAALMMAVG
jgi:predicted nucleic acid-binding Zn ribbon protein